MQGKCRVLLLSCLLVVILGGCDTVSTNAVDPVGETEGTIDLADETESTTDFADETESTTDLVDETEGAVGVMDEDIGCENQYFYSQRITYLTADVVYGDFQEKAQGELEIKWLKKYDNGDLFKLTVMPIDDITKWLGEERLNIYIYVTSDEIYRLWSYVFQDEESIEFYNDDVLLMEILDTDEKLVENGELICCMENVYDELEDSEVGTHKSIIVKEDGEIVYSRADVTPNGEPYFYELFRFKIGDGLIEYKSGYRAERDPLYIDNISVKP